MILRCYHYNKITILYILWGCTENNLAYCRDSLLLGNTYNCKRHWCINNYSSKSHKIYITPGLHVMHSSLLKMKLFSGKFSAICKLTWRLSKSVNYKKIASQMLGWFCLWKPCILSSQLPDHCRSNGLSRFKFPACTLCKALGRKRWWRGFLLSRRKHEKKRGGGGQWWQAFKWMS